MNKSQNNLLMRVLRTDRPSRILSNNRRIIMDSNGNIRVNLANPDVRRGIKSRMEAFSKIQVEQQKPD